MSSSNIVLSRHALACSLPSRELYDAWARNGLSDEEVVAQRPYLAEHIQQLTDTFMDKEDERLKQVTMASSEEPACDVMVRRWTSNAQLTFLVPSVRYQYDVTRG